MRACQEYAAKFTPGITGIYAVADTGDLAIGNSGRRYKGLPGKERITRGEGRQAGETGDGGLA